MSKIIGFGITIDINHFDEASFQKKVTALKQLKVQWVRIEIDHTKYNNQQKLLRLKRFCLLCMHNNINVVGLLTQFIPLTVTNLFFSHTSFIPIMNQMDTYVIFIREIVTLLKESISSWELWNEQNSKRFWVDAPSPKEYVSFVATISNIIGDVDPSAQLIFGGVFGNDVSPLYPFVPKQILIHKQYIQECITLGIDKYIDLYAFHPYSRQCYFSLSNSESIFNSIKKNIQETKNAYKNIPLIISEIGVSPVLNPRLSPYDIARIYKGLIDYSEKIGIPTCIYILADQHSKHYSRFNPDRDFGFLDYQLNPKPLFNEFLKLL